MRAVRVTAELPRWRGAPLLPLSWYVVAAIGASAPLAFVLGTGHTLAWRDTATLFAPLRPVIEQAFREGRLPLWNPHEALGVPLLAQMLHGALHPFSIAAALFPGVGIDALLVAHVVLGALGAAFLARRLGASPAASLVAAFGYALSGYVLGLTANVQYLAGAGAAPWVIATIRSAGGGGARTLVTAAAFVAVSTFAGDPQWTIVAVTMGTALALEAHGRRGVGRAALAIALGAAIAAVQILPTWSYLRETVRSSGLTAADRVQWALSPWRIVEFVAPGFFGGRPGAETAPVFQLLGGATQFPVPFLPSVFLGAPLLVLAGAGARAGRATRWLCGFSVLFLWIALGPALGADQVLRFVQVWGGFRYAEKLVGPLTLCVAVLAAIGADRLAARPRAAAFLCAGTALAAAAVAAALASLSGRPETALVAGRLATGLVHCAVGTGAFAALLFACEHATVRQGFPALASAMLFVQSASASQFALHAGAAGARDEQPLRALRKPGTITRIAVPLGKYFSIGPPGFDDWDRHVAILSRMGAVPFNVPTGIDSVQTYTGLLPRRFNELDTTLQREFGPAAWGAWRRYGLDHVVINEVAGSDPEQQRIAGAATSGGELVLKDEAWRFGVWKVPSRPWAFFASGAVQATSSADSRRSLADLLESGTQDVVVEGPAPRHLAPGRILSASREDERVTIVAETEAEGLLVVNEAYWPGWTATVDGRSSPILPADALVRAVPWPAGRHVLELRYEPPEVRAGAVISALALVLALWLVRGRVRLPFPPAQV